MIFLDNFVATPNIKDAPVRTLRTEKKLGIFCNILYVVTRMKNTFLKTTESVASRIRSEWFFQTRNIAKLYYHIPLYSFREEVAVE